MTSYPWEPDRQLTLDGARAAIQERFPAIDTRALMHLGSGWEFDAYRTSDGWVFRFPRRAECAEFFEPERRVHRLVAAHLPRQVALPHVELLGEPTSGFPYRFAAHRFIPGVAADALDASRLPALARDIARAFAALHSIPEGTARSAGVGEIVSDDLGRSEWFERGIRVARDIRGLDAAVDAALKWLTGLRLPPPDYAGPLHVIHHDLGPEHLVVDPATGRLRAIIDWTDAILGDPMRDIVALVPSLGWTFTEQVLRHYSPRIDAASRERLRFLARLLSVMWLTEAYERRLDVEKHIAWVHNAFAA